MAKAKKLHDLLVHSERRFPNHTALISEGNSINYSGLYRCACDATDLLVRSGISAGDRVGLYSEKSIDLVACIFGILQSGGVYVPLDVHAPFERNHYVIERCEATFLFAAESLAGIFAHTYDLSGHLNGLVLLKRKKEAISKSPEDLAYILHTSGSTGKPKGVMYTHRAALTFVDWCSHEFQLTERDRFSSHAPFHFDLSIFDLFATISHGATLVLISDKAGRQPMLLPQLISEHKLTIWYSTPTILRLMCEYGRMEKHDLSSLRLVLFAGEVYPLPLFKELHAKLSHVQYYNLYGPTETNVCSYYKIGNVEALEEHIPIGKICEHYRSKIDGNQHDGELLIAGDALMAGYWGSEELTMEKMIQEAGTSWYKTGDLVSLDQQEQLVFKGRTDRMIKRHGYRIELDEIEKTLISHPHIVSCAVVAKPAGSFSVRITAYLLATEQLNRSVIGLKALCMELLPAYMIPDDFIFVPEIPITSGHKTDYQKLITMVP